MALQPFPFSIFDPVFFDDFVIEPVIKRQHVGGNQVSSVSSNSLKAFSPILSADLIESENSYSMHVDLPGVPKEDIDISVQGNTVTIKAERKEVHEAKSDTVHRIERSYGTVQRTLRLPKSADASSASAKVDNGVLTLSFAKKAPEEGPRKVQVA